MIVETPCGTPWRIEDATRKLELRAQLPGARVFDHVADALRRAKSAGASATDRLHLALPASWLVNSPAISRVLRRWALAPDRDTWIALIDALERGAHAETSSLVSRLGEEPYAVEAISKVLALVVPSAVPLMPPAARAFVLGASAPSGAASFVAMIEWFRGAATHARDELEAIAASHATVPLEAAQVLDRLLWFDSEGHRHFAR